MYWLPPLMALASAIGPVYDEPIPPPQTAQIVMHLYAVDKNGNRECLTCPTIAALVGQPAMVQVGRQEMVTADGDCAHLGTTCQFVVKEMHDGKARVYWDLSQREKVLTAECVPHVTCLQSTATRTVDLGREFTATLGTIQDMQRVVLRLPGFDQTLTQMRPGGGYQLQLAFTISEMPATAVVGQLALPAKCQDYDRACPAVMACPVTGACPAQCPACPACAPCAVAKQVERIAAPPTACPGCAVLPAPMIFRCPTSSPGERFDYFTPVAPNVGYVQCPTNPPPADVIQRTSAVVPAPVPVLKSAPMAPAVFPAAMLLDVPTQRQWKIDVKVTKEEDGQEKVVSAPTLIAMDNQVAHISMGSETPAPSYLASDRDLVRVGLTMQFQVKGMQDGPAHVSLTVTRAGMKDPTSDQSDEVYMSNTCRTAKVLKPGKTATFTVPDVPGQGTLRVEYTVTPLEPPQ